MCVSWLGTLRSFLIEDCDRRPVRGSGSILRQPNFGYSFEYAGLRPGWLPSLPPHHLFVSRIAGLERFSANRRRRFRRPDSLPMAPGARLCRRQDMQEPPLQLAGQPIRLCSLRPPRPPVPSPSRRGRLHSIRNAGHPVAPVKTSDF